MLKLKYLYEITIILFCITIVGLLYSRFMISAGTIGLSVLWIFAEDPRQSFVHWKKNTLAICALVVLVIFLFSFINTGNYSGYWGSLKNKMPYLFIPLSMIGIKKMGVREQNFIAGLFILLLIISSFLTFSYYLSHASAVNSAYEKGQILPTIIHHVSYSLLLVVGVLLAFKKCLDSKGWVLFFSGIILLWLVFMIHLLAIRTGLICLYITLPVYIACVFIERRSYRTLLFAVAGLLITGIILFSTVKTIQKKVAYVLYDLEQIQQHINSDNQLSDSRRLLTDKMGWEIALQHPRAGVGIGDVQDEMDLLYNKSYPEFKPETRGHIHNEFIYIFAGCGFILGTVFIVVILIPLIYYFYNRSFLMGSVYLSVLMVLFWEPFLEYQLGSTIYLLLLAFGINQTKKD